MKKLLVALAVAAMATVSANALTIAWSGTALDDSGAYLNGGMAYLVQLAGSDLAATFDGSSWKMNGDTIIASTSIDDSAGSTGYYAGVTEVSTAKGTMYAVVLTTEGSSPTALPTSGYYGVTVFEQTKDPTGQDALSPLGVSAPDTSAYQNEIKGGQTPEPPTPAVPEPTTYALVGLAVAALALRKRLSK